MTYSFPTQVYSYCLVCESITDHIYMETQNMWLWLFKMSTQSRNTLLKCWCQDLDSGNSQLARGLFCDRLFGKKLSMPWFVCLCLSCLWFLNISIKNCSWWGHARLSFRWQCNFHQAAFLHFYESIQLWPRSRQTTHSQSKKQEKQKLWPSNFSSASNFMAWRSILKCVCKTSL